LPPATTRSTSLPAIVSDVADPHVVRGAVDREAERIAEAVCEDLRIAAAPDEGVARRDAVGLSARRIVDVDPQDLAEERRGHLSIGVVGGLAERQVQVAVLPERDPAAVVLRDRAIERQHLRVRGERCASVRRGEVADLGRERRRGVRREGDVHAPVRRELRMEREAEEASLEIGEHRLAREGRDVGDHRRHRGRARGGERHDLAEAARHEPARSIAGRLRHRHRGLEAHVREDLFELHPRGGRRSRGGDARRVRRPRVEAEGRSRRRLRDDVS
jgi:hypothetical protein